MNKLKYIEEVNILRKTLSNSDIESILAFFYIKNNNISFNKSPLVSELISDIGRIKIDDIENKYETIKGIKDIEELVIGYEVLFSKQEKTKQGIVFTPKKIKEFMIDRVLTNRDRVPKIIDPSCGCASFIITIAKQLVDRFKISYKEAFEQYIYGIDINKDNLRRTEILINLLILKHKEELPERLNLYHANALDFNFSEIAPGKFDIVIGNPPYVRAKNIDLEIKETLGSWEVVAGNVDLYIVFFQLGCEIVATDGVVSFITPNTYINSLNGRNLRKYLSDINRSILIHDFKDKQMFDSSLNYTCITTIDFSQKKDIIGYIQLDESMNDKAVSYYRYSDFPEYKPWVLTSKNNQTILDKITSQDISLGSYKIRNGLATLKNDIYFFKPDGEDENYYHRKYNNKEYKIEKGLCIDIAKPNVLKTEEALAKNKEVAIFPYEKNTNKIIQEEDMEYLYPEAYDFLRDNIHILESRDKGNTSKYAAWYAYGRTQGLNNQGKKLLIPYMGDKGYAVLALEERLLFYCGYGIFSDNVNTLRMLKRFIESIVFEFFIRITSKPYANGYVSLAKNYIKEFKIPNLNEDEVSCLLELKDKESIDRYICRLYDIDYKEICKNIKT